MRQAWKKNILERPVANGPWNMAQYCILSRTLRSLHGSVGYGGASRRGGKHHR